MISSVSRESHLQIFGFVGIDGVRLTELAARCQIGLAASSELVDNLVELGYLERRPDRRPCPHGGLCGSMGSPAWWPNFPRRSGKLLVR